MLFVRLCVLNGWSSIPTKLHQPVLDVKKHINRLLSKR